MEIRYRAGESWLGKVLVGCREGRVCAILLGDSEEVLGAELGKKFRGAELVEDAGLEGIVGRVVGLVESPGMGPGKELVLDVRGTAFQERVWEVLRQIPAGETRTYTEVAALMGAPKSVRAVASACGANKLAVVIPCHRVVAANGGLAGYRWGVERKRLLLEREQRLEK